MMVEFIDEGYAWMNMVLEVQAPCRAPLTYVLDQDVAKLCENPPQLDITDLYCIDTRRMHAASWLDGIYIIGGNKVIVSSYCRGVDQGSCASLSTHYQPIAAGTRGVEIIE